MRRVGRWMLNGLTALSLVLCVGTCVLWVRSYWHADLVTIGYQDMHLCVYAFTERGAFTLGADEKRFQGVRYEDHDPDSYYAELTPQSSFRRWQLAGFEYARNKAPEPWLRLVTLPIALLTFVTGILPAFAARRILRKRRLRGRNICQACHYDLTANISGVCPECGMKIAEAK